MKLSAAHYVGFLNGLTCSQSAPFNGTIQESLWAETCRRSIPALNVKTVCETLREIGPAHHCSIGEVAVAWVLRQPAVTGAITGLRRPALVDAIVGAAELRLHEDEIALIESHVGGAE